jgi:hypothetical protein
MTVKNLFIFGAVVCLLFGLQFIFIPQALAKMVLIDPTLTDGAIATFRNYGILLSSVAIGQMAARNSKPSVARRGFLILITLSAIFNTINTVYSIIAGIGNNKAWGIVIITTILSIWAVVLLSKEKALDV